jgi:thymidylate kinase
VRNRYLELARAAPARFRIVDATQPLDQVAEAAIAALDDALGLTPA